MMLLILLAASALGFVLGELLQRRLSIELLPVGSPLRLSSHRSDALVDHERHGGDRDRDVAGDHQLQCSVGELDGGDGAAFPAAHGFQGREHSVGVVLAPQVERAAGVVESVVRHGVAPLVSHDSRSVSPFGSVESVSVGIVLGGDARC